MRYIIYRYIRWCGVPCMARIVPLYTNAFILKSSYCMHFFMAAADLTEDNHSFTVTYYLRPVKRW